MKKIVQVLLIFFAAMPLLFHAQGQLVKWYHGDFSPSLTEQHISSAALAAYGGVQKSNETWGDQDVFYSFSGWPAPVWNQAAEERFDDKKYVQFTVKPDAGYQLQMEKFTFSARMQGSTGSMRVRFSKDNFSTYTDMLPQPVVVTSTYATYSLSFPDNTVVNSDKDETLYVRVYVYNTNNNFHIKHNASGSIAPTLFGKVMLSTLTPPVAHDDHIGTVKNKAVNADILLNDEYKYTQPVSSIAIVQQSANGLVTVNGTANVTYTPNAGFTGYDDFYYTLTNSQGVSNTAKVQVQVVDGQEQVLTRWNNNKPKDYVKGVVGVQMTKHGDMELSSTGNVDGFNVFTMSNLATPRQFDGTPDLSSYVELGVKVGDNNDFSGLLTHFSFDYKSYGDAFLTVKYSKSKDFSGNVYTLMDGQKVGTTFSTANRTFEGDNFLYPGETVYIRIYGYNTWNNIFLKFKQDSDTEGPAITGVISDYYPAPCSETVTWSGLWSKKLNGEQKIIIDAPFTLNSGETLSACSCTVTDKGSMMLKSGSTLIVKEEITNSPKSTFIVEDGANLIQTDNAAVNTGNIEVQKAFTFSNDRKQYNYVSSPTVGTNLKSIYTGTLDNSVAALYYTESNDRFGISSGAYIAGRALALKEKDSGSQGTSAQPSRFKGVPFNGLLDYPLAFSNAQHGYNLVGNPYPSNLDIEKLYQLNSNAIDATFYFWDNRGNQISEQQGSNYNGANYAKYNAVSGTPVGAGVRISGGNRLPDGYVSPAQGFLVQAKAAGQVLKFSNTKMRVSSGSTNFFGKSGAGTESEKDRYWLTLKAPSSIETMMAVVYFNKGQKTVAPEDSENSGSSDEIYSMVGVQGLSINGLPVFDNEDVVAVGYRAFAAGTHTISLFNRQGTFNNGQSIYLKDKELNTITDLTQGDYAFETQKGTFTNRFEIVYKPQTILATDQAKSSSVMVYLDATDFVVQSSDKKIDWVEVYDMSGRLYKTIKGGDKTVRFSAQEMAQGMYILKIVREGEVSSKRILK